MSVIVTLIVELAALLGHAIFLISCMNWLHSTTYPRKAVDFAIHSLAILLFLLPAAAAWWCFRETIIPFGPRLLTALPEAMRIYLWFCVTIGVVGIVWWSTSSLRRQIPKQFLSTHVTPLDLREVGQPTRDDVSRIMRWLVQIPWNEALRPCFVEREILLSRLPKELDGLVMTHLTDLHFNGRIGWGYLEEMLDLSNRQQPDFVMLTGDLLDRMPMAERLVETLTRLEAKVGRYFILGNHDRLIDHTRLRRLLSEAGLTDLGGSCKSVLVQGHQILIAGNEIPWFPPAGDFDACDQAHETRPLRVALSHSPDQIHWAVAKDVDLMLAGHLHGGQICLPWIGPVRSPSRYRFKYMEGVHYHAPTVLSMSRGIAAQLPLRWNCPPELVKLVLRSGDSW